MIWPVSCEALPVSIWRMTSFVVASAKRFHQVLAVDAIEVGRVVVVPDAHPVRLGLVGRFVDRVGCRLQEIRRLVDVRRKRPDDQVLVADGLVEFDRGREPVTLEFGEGVMETARLELDRVEVFPPLRARLLERVFEFDAVEPGGRERPEGAWNVGGELRAHAPELRADRDALPGGSGRCRQRGEDEGGGRCGAAELEDVAPCRMRVHGMRPFDWAHPTLDEPARASGWRAQPAAARLTD